MNTNDYSVSSLNKRKCKRCTDTGNKITHILELDFNSLYPSAFEIKNQQTKIKGIPQKVKKM